MSKAMRKKRIGSVLYQVICLSIGLIIAFPILYAIGISFMEPSEILTKSIHLIPNQLQLSNYTQALRLTRLGRYMINSTIISLISSIVRVLLASLAAFAFAFFEFKGKKFLFLLSMSTMMIPGDVVLISNYKTVAAMKLTNTYMGMMIIFFVSVINIFMIRQSFLSLSKELLEAAKIDGCSNFRIYRTIILPISKPVLATVFISSFVVTWNTYLWPMLVTSSDSMRTVQAGIAMLSSADGGTIYGPIMAASTLVLIPTILIFVIFQKQIVGGMVSGAVKG